MDINTFKPKLRYDLGEYYISHEKTGTGGYYHKYIEIQIKGVKARVRLHDRIPSKIVSGWIPIEKDNKRGLYIPIKDKKIYLSDCIVIE